VTWVAVEDGQREVDSGCAATERAERHRAHPSLRQPEVESVSGSIRHSLSMSVIIPEFDHRQNNVFTAVPSMVPVRGTSGRISPSLPTPLQTFATRLTY
jgi:hypothetical protein